MNMDGTGDGPFVGKAFWRVGTGQSLSLCVSELFIWSVCELSATNANPGMPFCCFSRQDAAILHNRAAVDSPRGGTVAKMLEAGWQNGSWRSLGCFRHVVYAAHTNRPSS